MFYYAVCITHASVGCIWHMDTGWPNSLVYTIEPAAMSHIVTCPSSVEQLSNRVPLRVQLGCREEETERTGGETEGKKEKEKKWRKKTERKRVREEGWGGVELNEKADRGRQRKAEEYGKTGRAQYSGNILILTCCVSNDVREEPNDKKRARRMHESHRIDETTTEE